MKKKSDYGQELVITDLCGKRRASCDAPSMDKVLDEGRMLCGRFMGVSISRVLLNVPLQTPEDWDEVKMKRFTLVELLLKNVCDRPINIECYSDNYVLVDSDDFQRNGTDLDNSFELAQTSGGNVPVAFPYLRGYLLDGAKTKGWLAFDEFASGVLPKRFAFRFCGDDENGYSVTETLEFFLENCSTRPLDLEPDPLAKYAIALS